jgi:hypothetical protein
MSALGDDPILSALLNNWSVHYPGDRELFIDVDNDADLAHYDAMLPVLTENGVFVESETRTVSPGGNWHIRLVLVLKFGHALTPEMRIALQAALGSDRKRELLSSLRILFGLDRPPTVFFEKEDVA